jgi:hypothetical protein
MNCYVLSTVEILAKHSTDLQDSSGESKPTSEDAAEIFESVKRRTISN